MTTASSNNSFVEDGKLYIVPTLTADVIGYNNVLDGYTYNITGCTNSNRTSPSSLPLLFLQMSAFIPSSANCATLER